MIAVTPDPKYIAEVLVLITTLKAKRTEFYEGKRAKDLLEIKRVHFKVVDFNRDAREGGFGDGAAENRAIRKLMERGKLMTGPNDDLVLPQIFIDGQYVGGLGELQVLEDDGQLDKILLRQDAGWRIEEILPGEMTIEARLREMAQNQNALPPPPKEYHVNYPYHNSEYEDDGDDDDDYEDPEEEEEGGEAHAGHAG